ANTFTGSVGKGEIGYAIGGGGAGLPVDGQSRGADRDQPMSLWGVGRNGQRDQDFAIRVHFSFAGLAGGELAFDAIEQDPLFVEKVQTNLFQPHARALFFLFEIAGPDLIDLAALLVAFNAVPVFGLAGEIEWEHGRLCGRLLFDGAAPYLVGDPKPA